MAEAVRILTPGGRLLVLDLRRHDHRLEGGRLLLRRRGVDDLTLSPTVADAFRAPNLMFAFTRGAGGKVDGLIVGAGRVKSITFRRTG